MIPSRSSEICSSNAETSMPRLSTSRILPTPSVTFLPGMKAPGGANTPFIPVRAFGAPQTTWMGSPLPTSTMQTRSRSAFGCCFASTTRAMTNGANSFALSSMRSTSSPIMVSLSASSASGRSVSTCSFSQSSVNFIESTRQRMRSRARSLPGNVQIEQRQAQENQQREHDGGAIAQPENLVAEDELVARGLLGGFFQIVLEHGKTAQAAKRDHQIKHDLHDDHALLEIIVGDDRRRNAERSDHHRGMGEKPARLAIDDLKAAADHIRHA